MEQLFSISRLDASEVDRISSEDNGPHIHDYEELLIGMQGRIGHFIDFKSKNLFAPFISFVSQGKAHLVKPGPKDGKCDMWMIRFKSEFIPETTFQLYSWYHEHANLEMEPGPYFDRMTILCEMMWAEMQQTIPDFAVLRQLLNLLFTMIESERKKLGPSEGSLQKTQNITFKNFLKILEENFRRPEGVDFYAEKLFMTSRNLNLICKNILQKSVSEIIETRKLTEAKNLLMHSGKTVSEIGFELGYNEKAYFTNVFRKRTGQTPTEFREEMKKLIS
ncbi:MAG: AraC family transcriptional regulator [Bacteroidota bacterium]|jgi:AraC family transcriptional regulator, transcriptional activator of pobA